MARGSFGRLFESAETRQAREQAAAKSAAEQRVKDERQAVLHLGGLALARLTEARVPIDPASTEHTKGWVAKGLLRDVVTDYNDMTGEMQHRYVGVAVLQNVGLALVASPEWDAWDNASARGDLKMQARGNLFETTVPLTESPAEDYRQLDQQARGADGYLSQQFHYHAHGHQLGAYNEAGVERQITAVLAHIVQDPHRAATPDSY